MTVAVTEVVSYLELILRTHDIPDYSPALNGLQVQHDGPVTGIAAATDCSRRSIRGAVDANANFLMVHHGLFWGGLQPLTGALYDRVRLLVSHDVALYASHLPLDAHETFGNSRLLAREIGLDPTEGFGRYQTIHCGVRGTADVATADLVDRVRAFARLNGGDTVVTFSEPARRTRNWAICSGAGANAETIREAVSLGVDTLVVGEGPHLTAVDAPERGLVIVYAGHYATETLGIKALAQHVAARFELPWSFIPAPTGL